MHRFLEILLGLDRGFLSRQGELHLEFNPHWPGSGMIGAGTWNFFLALIAVLLVIYVYRQEGKSRAFRIALGTLRAALLALVIVLLNNPTLTLGQLRREPSVLAVLVDDSISMKVKDVTPAGSGTPLTRLDAAADLLTGKDRQLLKDLAKQHILKFYRLLKLDEAEATSSRAAQAIASFDENAAKPTDPTDTKTDPLVPVSLAIHSIKPEGQTTQIMASLRAVLDDLQGQRLAGVVLLTDGRENPPPAQAEAAIATVTKYGVRVYPVAIGTDKTPKNISIEDPIAEDSVFVDDITNIRVKVRATGYETGHSVQLVLKDKSTGLPLMNPDGHAVETRVVLPDENPVEAELHFQPGKDLKDKTVDLVVEAIPQPGELDEADNVRNAQVAVLDPMINVLFVDGYPRWEYRYIKTEIIREEPRGMNISCLLTSADPTFTQEGTVIPNGKDWRIRAFPESIEQLMQWDVVLFGDVDPRQFTDRQLQMVNEFVNKKGGGFEMVAGPKWSPQAFHNTPIEPILPVDIRGAEADDPTRVITEGYRPVVTKDGANSSIFRFFPDRDRNDRYLKNDIQELFWFCRGITVGPSGIAYAVHPTEMGPDHRPAPILVAGKFGAGRTLFSAIDDSWRWRFYTGESVFRTYWMQQLRFLARSKKLGQRGASFVPIRPTVELGQQVSASMKVLSPTLQQQLPDQLTADVIDETTGTVIRQETLVRQEGSPENYNLSFTSDRTGRFEIRLPPINGQSQNLSAHVQVEVPKLELAEPRVNPVLLANLADATKGQLVPYDQARVLLPQVIKSVAKTTEDITSRPLWDAPLGLFLFATIITVEWVLRKMQGLL